VRGACPRALRDLRPAGPKRHLAAAPLLPSFIVWLTESPPDKFAFELVDGILVAYVSAFAPGQPAWTSTTLTGAQGKSN
jgi:hypothetical protein